MTHRRPSPPNLWGSDVRPGLLPCPICRGELALDHSDWVACQRCLARHHSGCWEDVGQCGSCGEGRARGIAEAEAHPVLPLIRVALAAAMLVFVVVAAAVISRDRASATVETKLRTPRTSTSVAAVFLSLPTDPIVPDAPPGTIETPAGEIEEALRGGDVAFDGGDFQRAADRYGHALQADPSLVPAWVGRGNARAQLGDLNGALVDLQRALDLTGLDEPRRPLIEADFDVVQQRLAEAERRSR